ncbi:adenylate/guanylate cyclase domain-containing protein [Fulvivirga lutimaris]|uniref:adenylate/guanylate cyclase domain-containing protein n=1 Tax=Fulvivirga lutimaris TaxID=1819566 RepID=UPI0012BB5662|nr:adenylate/guanylate cyclase domain-containing protein [Fulvivirga lutimaris]MTI40034.1 adenylate/guanylate cyclase domain-containing protein [Fulvivirga lutimaris]
MKFKNRRNWQIIKQFSIGWTLAFLFLSFVRGEGTVELGSVQFELVEAFLGSILMGPILGSISGIAQVLTEEYGYKQISLQKLLVLRAIFVVLFLTFMILLAYAVYGENITLIEFAFEPGSFAIYFYIVFVDIFMVSLRLVILFFGSNNLWKLLRGKYYTPSDEERIFMFLDLQSSTEHAERLGHITYSKMIQDCFNDLGVVIENEAEIYQYVGDEVILTWKLKVGLRNQNCINAYYHFQKELLKKKDYYLEKYNSQPHFKAGLNEGLVTVTEIGKYKKEIAYHGDPINTAARIQGKCNELQKELLISENLKTKLTETDFTFEELGKIELRGKEKQVLLYAVHKKA